MDAPASFWVTAARFHQDVSELVGPSEIELADYLIRGLNLSDRLELSGFLDKVFLMPDAGAQLMRFWQKSRADFGFEGVDQIGAFFAVVRRRL